MSCGKTGSKILT